MAAYFFIHLRTFCLVAGMLPWSHSVGHRVVNFGISGNPGHIGLELGYLRIVHCVKATLGMDQKTLKKLVESISNTVKNFKKSEVECLLRLFHSLVERANVRLNNFELDRNAFRAILHSIFGMTDDILMNRVCFEVYYLNGDGYISREEIFDMLKNSLCQQSSEEETDEGIKELVDITLKKVDYDNDGKISFADFEKAVKEERLLLEVFGPCLPEAKNCIDFETLAFGHILTSSFGM
ncbi:EF-hand calcium-binding domain-containing protein 1-like isoform X1 [Zalophus californianus]|uniref:EF-hand calcium-binding domain-containing protein 1-like isoform X1 n=1 Tax=Zalophus californianus TaxID=9704 RepID=A0A6J2BE34_ZALCA|nr:EF-hand calcium-binding domain-containing protein 1-like isoform X1 [Zalophus californianus]